MNILIIDDRRIVDVEDWVQDQSVEILLSLQDVVLGEIKKKSVVGKLMTQYTDAHELEEYVAPDFNSYDPYKV